MVRSLLLVAIAVIGSAIDASAQDALSEALFGYQHDTSPAGEIPSADLMSLALPALADEEPPCDGVPIEGEFVLDRDVSCTVRLAAYATLDLNGFTLQGWVRGPFGGSSGVTIKNGTILAGPIDCSYDDCTIENVRILDGPSFTVLAGAGTRISDCFFSGNGVAVDLYYGGGPASVVIENSTFEDNDIAINIAKYNLASISSNTFRGNLVGVNLYDELNDEVNFNTIADNYFTDNFIGVRFSVRGCVYGVCQIGNRVVGNDFVGNRGSGVVFDGSGTGCSYGDCENVDASIEDNVFSGNGFGPPPDPPLSLPIIDDGITVLGAPEVRDGVTIAGNVSVSNSDLGIEAPDVIDGGGNRASGNGNPLECVGVVCTPACGDGSVLVPETCDDGNTAAGDGCSIACVVEAGFTCTGEPSVCASLAPSIEVAPRQYNFGLVDLGTSSAQIVTISNTGDAPLVVDGVALLAGSGVGFELTDAPTVPFEIEPNATVDIGLLFTPLAGGAANATLRVTSNDPEEPIINISLTGSGVSYGAQAMALLSFFDGLVASGDLVGEGPGHSASGRLNALRNMIEASGDLIDRGKKAKACKQLQDARLRTDGLFPPPDFASGAAAPELEAEIAQLRSNLRCDVPRGGGGCGLGAELALVMPLLGLVASRRRRAN